MGMSSTRRIVVTGGPGGGKTTAADLFRREIGGETWWGHDGYWGTTAFTCPARDVTIVTGHQRSDMPEAFDRLEILGKAFASLSDGET